MNMLRLLLTFLAIVAMANVASAQSYLETPQHNPINGLDVDDNGLITPRDLLIVIDSLQQANAHNAALPLLAVASMASTAGTTPLFVDTNADGHLSPADVLVLVDHFAVTAVAPEPSSLISAAIGLFMMAGYAWRRRRSQR
jgi:hypothetical protein